MKLIPQFESLAGVVPGAGRFTLPGSGHHMTVNCHGGEGAEHVEISTTMAVAGDAARAGYRGRGLPTVETSSVLAIYVVPRSSNESPTRTSPDRDAIETGDTEFDRRLCVKTQSAPQIAREVLGPVAARAAILELFDHGCTQLLLDDSEGNLVARFATPAKSDENPDKATRIVGTIEALRGALPAILRKASQAPAPRSGRPTSFWKFTAWIVAVGCVLLLALVLALVAALSRRGTKTMSHHQWVSHDSREV